MHMPLCQSAQKRQGLLHCREGGYCPVRMLKPIARVVPVILFVIVFAPVQWLAVRFGWWFQDTIPNWFNRLIIRMLGVRVTIDGELAAKRPLLLVSNHVSWLDIMVLGSISPLSFIAKAEVRDWPVFGFLAVLQRTVFVDRARRSQTHSVNLSVAERLKAGDIMVLFPEGTTGDGTRLLPFKSALLGAAREAAGPETIVSVQSCVIAYTHRGGLPMSVFQRAEEVAWAGDVTLMPHLLGILRGSPVDVTVRFGTALPFGPDTDRKALTRTLEEDVQTGLVGLLRP
jgi:lyso-ornithine lipid O-acyltransferase